MVKPLTSKRPATYEDYRIVLTAAAEDKVRAEPFDAIELDLAILWAR
jgi:hypothetical protein